MPPVEGAHAGAPGPAEADDSFADDCDAWTSVTVDDLPAEGNYVSDSCYLVMDDAAALGPLPGEHVAGKGYAVSFASAAAAAAGEGSAGTLFVTSARVLFVPFKRGRGRQPSFAAGRMAVASVRELATTGHGEVQQLVEITTKTSLALCVGFPYNVSSSTLFQLLMRLGLDWRLAPAFNLRTLPAASAAGWAAAADGVARDYSRLGLAAGEFRLCRLNADYALAPTYPAAFVVPRVVTDDELRASAAFRSKGRLPAIVYRHRGALLVRCAQPMVGLTSARCPEDELLLDVVRRLTPAAELHVLDLRHQTAALGNRALGGGSECAASYGAASSEFCGLGNIHAVRDSRRQLFEAVRAETTPRAAAAPDEADWLPALHATGWLAHVQRILAAAERCAALLERGGAVVVHCSDGWDRTPQVCALAQLLLDAHYRTTAGFAALVEKEWCSFGHQFAVRFGHQRGNVDCWTAHESSPVFLQFLDCVWQLTRQFPRSFEFSGALLAELHDVAAAARAGTFLGNCERERLEADVRAHTAPAWSLLGRHVNPYYEGPSSAAPAAGSAGVGGGAGAGAGAAEAPSAVSLAGGEDESAPAEDDDAHDHDDDDDDRLTPDTRAIALQLWTAVHAPQLQRDAEVATRALQREREQLQSENAALRQQLLEAQRRARDATTTVQRLELQLRRARAEPVPAGPGVGRRRQLSSEELDVQDSEDGESVLVSVPDALPDPAAEMRPFQVMDGYFGLSAGLSAVLGGAAGGAGAADVADMSRESSAIMG